LRYLSIVILEEKEAQECQSSDLEEEQLKAILSSQGWIKPERELK
jgi:hypothetical protein